MGATWASPMRHPMVTVGATSPPRMLRTHLVATARFRFTADRPVACTSECRIAINIMSVKLMCYVAA